MKASNFKFIAWNHAWDEFINPRTVEKQVIPVQATRKGFKLKSEFELFQYTGFNDSKGKEIYDGHILTVNYHKKALKDKHITIRYNNGGFLINDYIDDLGKEFFMPIANAIESWKKAKATYLIVGHIKTHG